MLGPPFDVPVELPLFQALASLAMAAGLGPDVSTRVTGLATYVLTALLLWLLVHRLAGAVAANVSLAAFLFSPLGLLWSRASTIEWLATAGALGAVLFALSWLESGRRLHWAVALVAATVGMLVKVTTGLFWLLPILGHRLDLGTRRRDAMLAVLFVVPVAAAAAWTRYADSVKAAQPETSELTSAGLTGWNFGTLEQRLDLENWALIAGRTAEHVLGPFAIVLLVGLAVGLSSSRRWTWAGVALACLLPVATFFNLYYVHDYYAAAILPGLAALVGIGAAEFWTRLPRLRGGLAALGALAIVATLQPASYLWSPMYEGTVDRHGLLAQAEELAAVSGPGDLVLVLGHDWDPSVLYYARRAGLMIADRNVQRAQSEGWLEGDYSVALARQPATDPLELLRHWAVIAPLGSRTYALRESMDGAVGLQVLGVFDPRAVPGNARLATGQEIRCGRDEVAVSSRGEDVWLALGTGPDRARIWITGVPAPLPLVAAIRVDGELARAGVKLSCSGAASVLVHGTFD